MASSTWAVDLILTFSCQGASNTCILDMFPICHSKKSLTKNLFVFYHLYLLTAMKPFRSWFNANTCEIFHLTWLVQSFVRIFQRRSWVTGIFCIHLTWLKLSRKILIQCKHLWNFPSYLTAKFCKDLFNEECTLRNLKDLIRMKQEISRKSRKIHHSAEIHEQITLLCLFGLMSVDNTPKKHISWVE